MARAAEGRPERAADRLGFAERIGAALVAPRRALRSAEADPGRTSGDAALLLVLYFACVHTEVLVSSGWLMLEGQAGAALQGVVGHLARAITAPLVFLFGGGVLLTLLAGRRRAVGSDFDLACVGSVPLLVVHGAAWLGLKLAGAQQPSWAHDAANVLGYGWAAVILVLGLLEARGRREDGADSEAGAEEGA